MRRTSHWDCPAGHTESGVQVRRKAEAGKTDLRGISGMVGVEDMAVDEFTKGKHIKR